MSARAPAEIAIVGAGPAGLYAAHYAGFRGLTTLLLEALPVVGGQITAFYPDAVLYDVPGFPAVTGRDLVARLYEQARRFPVDFRFAEEVVGIDSTGEELCLTSAVRGPVAATTTTRQYAVRAVLLTTGIGSFAAQRIKDPAIARYEGRGLSYDPPQPGALGGRRVLVVGGWQRAVDLALELAGTAAEVTLIHRRDRLKTAARPEADLAAAGVRFLPLRELVGLEGEPALQRAVLLDRRDGRRETIAVDAVVPCYGYTASAEGLRRFGLALEGDAAVVDSRMATSCRHVWAAGDGAAYPGKVRVLAADFGEACTAVNNIAAEIIPGASVFPGYSSHAGGLSRRRAS